jgi:hypothetical protein
MKTTSLRALFITLVFAIIFLYQGCDDSGIINPHVNIDTIRINYRDAVVIERNTLSTYSAVDILNGAILMEVSSMKDVILVDSFNLGQRFYFVAGNAFGPLGFETKFKNFVYDNLTQYQFDTIKVIPDCDSLCEDDFPDDYSGCFSDSIPARPVIGFYLEGKYESGYVYKPVYGVLYIDSTYRDSVNFSLRFDVKMNRAGQNDFR